MLNLMLVDMAFQTWFVISWQHSRQPIRIHVRISILTHMDFDMYFLCYPRHGLEIVNMTKIGKMTMKCDNWLKYITRKLLARYVKGAVVENTLNLVKSILYIYTLTFNIAFICRWYDFSICDSCKLIHKNIWTLLTIAYIFNFNCVRLKTDFSVVLSLFLLLLAITT